MSIEIVRCISFNKVLLLILDVRMSYNELYLDPFVSSGKNSSTTLSWSPVLASVSFSVLGLCSLRDRRDQHLCSHLHKHSL